MIIQRYIANNRSFDTCALLRRFRRDENGAILVMGLLFFMLALMIGGLGVDLMLAESKRANLQSVLDRSTIAAVGSSGTIPAEEVVAEWLAKSGIEGVSHTVSTDTSAGNLVTTTANVAVATHMIGLLGIDTLNVNSRTTAGAAGTIEIAIVVDNSVKGQNHRGKYADGTETMLELVQAAAGSARVYASVVPYTSSVSLPQEMWDLYAVDEFHTSSRCVEFDDASYGDVVIDPLDMLDQTAYFEVAEDSEHGWKDLDYPDCRVLKSSDISPFMDDPADVVTALADLEKGKWQRVAAQDGVKWGMALLDPASRPVVNDLIYGGYVDAALADMPRDYDSDDNYKVLILIFGHQGNTQRYALKPGFIQGYSPVWWDQGAEQMAVFYDDPGGSSPNLWEAPELRCKEFEDRVASFGGLTEGEINDFYTAVEAGNEAGALAAIAHGTAQPMTWADLLAVQPLQQYGTCLYDDIADDVGDATLVDYWNAALFEIEETRDSADAQLLAACQATKDAGIIVYTISDHVFDDRDETLLDDCATSPTHHFSSDEADQEEAFLEIGYNLGALVTTIKLQN